MDEIKGHVVDGIDMRSERLFLELCTWKALSTCVGCRLQSNVGVLFGCHGEVISCW